MSSNDLKVLSADFQDDAPNDYSRESKKINTADKLISAYINQCLSGQITPLKTFLQNMEKEILNRVLALTKWNQKLASQVLQVNEKTLSVKIKKYKLKHIPPNLDSLF